MKAYVARLMLSGARRLREGAYDLGGFTDGWTTRGKLRAVGRVPRGEEDRIFLSGVKVTGEVWDKDTGLVAVGFERPNAFVNTGLQITLDRLFGLGTPPAAVARMVVTNDTTAVTAATTLIDPGGADSKTFAAFDSTPTRSNQTVSATATFTNATANFSHRKIGLHNSTTDNGTGLINVIGGAGVAPYDEDFTANFTGASSFSLTYTIEVTASAT